jgi:hypothetical protein
MEDHHYLISVTDYPSSNGTPGDHTHVPQLHSFVNTVAYHVILSKNFLILGTQQIMYYVFQTSAFALALSFLILSLMQASLCLEPKLWMLMRALTVEWLFL